MLALVIVALLGVAQSARANGVPFASGDVLAGAGNGEIHHFDSNGNLLDTLDTTTGSREDTGMCFDSSGNLYVTDFGANTMSKFDSNGNLVAANFGSGFNQDPESCVFNSTNQVYVGQADGSANVLKFDASGNPLASYSPATDDRGTDWVDLAKDDCTLHYTSEGSLIKRFNVCTNTQLPDFASGLPGPCFAHRILSDGSELVACESEVLHLDSTGVVTMTYTPETGGFLFALNLDPDGTSFWTADIFTGEIFRIDIASGTVIKHFNNDAFTTTAGLTVVGEITAAQPNLTLAPLSQTHPVGATAKVAATLKQGGAPLSGRKILFSVTGANTASGSGSTDTSGQTSFSYVGADAGGDKVTACYDANNSGTCDPGEKTATATVTWTGGGVDPHITAHGTTFSATEGAGFTGQKAGTFTDPDPNSTASEYSAKIDWGDGSTSPGAIGGPKGGPFTVQGGHAYSEEGTKTVKVTITDVDNPSNSATATSAASVADAALHSTCAGPSTSTQAFSGPTASFIDDDPSGMNPADYTATIDWGDGSSSAGTITPATGAPHSGPYTVSGFHTYASTGPFTITTAIKDAGGSKTVATCKTLVFAFAAGGGAFVIGDGNRAIGTRVTFWGAQWWKNNSLSGGRAPASFKGFAKNPAQPSCGANWSTDPGNSAPPPNGPLPADMAVIVSSKITKSGSQISGDTVHIVVVKADGGYQQNPGHPGTGTIEAQIC